MFEIEKSHCVTIEQKILFNIMELLKKEAPEPITEDISEVCKLCGKDHNNIGNKLACAKKFKKGSG